MGPNGTGKSTLSYVVSGREGYDVTQGEVLLNGENILGLAPHERAAKGVFLAFQYPVEIPGVATMTFLKAALNSQRRARGEDELQTPDFMKRVNEAAARLGVVKDMLRRPLNCGFSGGERSAWKFCRWRCWSRVCAYWTRPIPARHRRAARRLGRRQRAARQGSGLPRHHPLPAVAGLYKPDTVHVMAKGRILRSGGPELALELESSGYKDYIGEAA